ncbi:DNA recombination protein RmuC [Janibacter alkaliphilus]|uniref:DNA recombination protein RmuC n=1 Tax=Janibacter alkaliphilus TaxID=1069963 RepID=A0A852X927_9MICO|nr:DNA recombination protein RmuC [Janibacter alkaliphilus]NYG37253.1 DNA recombination protein RmuC [Janibacter alkaliphilus]
MEITSLLLGLLLGLVVGAVVAASWLRGHGAEQGAQTAAELARAGAERDVLRERVVDLEAQLGEDAETAAALLPLRAALDRVEQQVGMIERERTDQFATVREALGRVEAGTAQVGREAASLAGSLRVSSVRGQWGEVQLRRVLEVSGLLPRCDFDEQAGGVNAHGDAVRPDVVVHLPGDKHLVIDAKAPMSRWLEAQREETPAERRDALLAEHAADLRRHVRALTDKAYWTAVEASPEMVVCFVPADATLAAALGRDPALHEEAMRSRVVLVSPATLLALLRTVAFTWQQEALGDQARELLGLGTELYQRLSTMAGHTARLGRSLQGSVEAYNRLVGTLESRVLVSARRMHELGVPGDPLPELDLLDRVPRGLSADELIEDARPASEASASWPGGRPDRRDGSASA